jgi:hypothetical protein
VPKKKADSPPVATADPDPIIFSIRDNMNGLAEAIRDKAEAVRDKDADRAEDANKRLESFGMGYAADTLKLSQKYGKDGLASVDVPDGFFDGLNRKARQLSLLSLLYLVADMDEDLNNR